ncbi:hypothetical protein NK638_10610 [Psychrobacter sp. A3]|nr:hypothetical protein [Psychrobacter sp. A3]MDE0491965.1 hypothetical protein [Psychrobacter sp. A3]
MNNRFDHRRAVATVPAKSPISVRRCLAPFVAISALVTLVGCGTGQNETASDDSQDTAAAAATGEVLRIGTEGAYAQPPLLRQVKCCVSVPKVLMRRSTIPMLMAVLAGLMSILPMPSALTCR